MYIDTSCLAAYYFPESKRKAAQVRMQESGHVFINYIAEVEPLSALKKKRRMGNLSEDDGSTT
ncbi:MAG TPA: hypothetical protein VJ915_02880 [Balneolaceae bacterium]|nr:hypothetical protein [Balneolaceae bacterium]